MNFNTSKPNILAASFNLFRHLLKVRFVRRQPVFSGVSDEGGLRKCPEHSQSVLGKGAQGWGLWNAVTLGYWITPCTMNTYNTLTISDKHTHIPFQLTEESGGNAGQMVSTHM